KPLETHSLSTSFARPRPALPSFPTRRSSDLKVNINRDQAARYGISPQAIDDTLYDAFGQRQVTQYFTQLNASPIILEILPELQRSEEHTSELQSRENLVCRLLLEKKNTMRAN